MCLDGSVFLVLGAGIGGIAVVGDGGTGVDGADRLAKLTDADADADADAWLSVSDGTSSIERTIVAIVVVLSLRCGHVL